MEKDLSQSLISIIMPAYNVENFISQSIESVINQTYQNWELIIIDDGSTDKTKDICNKYNNSDTRIKYYFQNNSRQSAARNKGIKLANGEIIAFLDADDLWLPEKISFSLKELNNINVDLLFTDTFYFNESESFGVYKDEDRMYIPNNVYKGDEGIKLFIESNRIPMLTVLAMKSALIKAGLFDESISKAEDYDLWLRMLKTNSSLKGVSVPLSVYRIRSGSVSASDRISIYEVMQIFKKNFTTYELRKLNLSKELKRWVREWVSHYFKKNNLKELKSILIYFNIITFEQQLIFTFLFWINTKIQRRILLYTLK